MLRQLILVLGAILLILAVGVLIFYFKPNSYGTVNLKDGIIPGNKITGELIRKEKFISVKPENGEEQTFTWDQVISISGNEPSYNKTLSDITDWLELITKLGILAAAGVFLIGLYQFDVGQRWKSEEFLAQTVKDFSSSANVENAKDMIDLLRFYPQGRDILLFYEEEPPKSIHIKPEQVGRALATVNNEDLGNEEMRIRESFDAFFSRLERFEHYIESGLVNPHSVRIYLNYWINLLNGVKTSDKAIANLNPEYRKWLIYYIENYEFPKVIELLERYRKTSFFGKIKSYFK